MWAYESVFYQIYPLGFVGAPFENDGVETHRILKVLDWTDHIKKLGANAIYFSPVFESDTHGYNTRDYRKIDCRLGSNEDFKQVCDKLHSEGIRVVLDGVFNHAGRGFWAFQDVLKNRENSPYLNWFHINLGGNSNYNDGLWYEGWEGNYDLVKLNLQNEEVVQYLLERLDIPCIYVDGSTKGSTEGHAWDIVKIGQEYYYVDATNGDQPDFLNGDAAQLEEHKTIIYDYLCPFPEEYEKTYTPSEELTVPACTAKDLDFYVLNQGYFEDYSWQDIYDYCKMRLDNGAAVVRFKFGSQEAFSEACQELLDDGVVQNVAQYYMKLHGLGQVEYHYGVMDNFYTIYFIF